MSMRVYSYTQIGICVCIDKHIRIHVRVYVCKNIEINIYIYVYSRREILGAAVST